MAGSGPWVAALSLFCLLAAVQLEKVVVVPLEAKDPAVDAGQLCLQYSKDGQSLHIMDLYDMINEKLEQYAQQVTSARLDKIMAHGDNNMDDKLDLKECKKLVDDIRSGQFSES